MFISNVKNSEILHLSKMFHFHKTISYSTDNHPGLPKINRFIKYKSIKCKYINKKERKNNKNID